MASTSAETAHRARAPRRGAPLPVAVGVAVLWANVVSVAPLVALAALATTGTPTGARGVVRFALGAWLLGQGVPIDTRTDHLTLVPLAVTLWVGWRLARAGVHVGRAGGAHRVRSVWPAVRSGLAVGVVHAGIGVLTAVLASGADVWVSPLRAGLMFGLVGTVCAAGGALLRFRSGRLLAARLPLVLRDAARAAGAAVAFLIAAGAATAGVALALSGEAAATMLHAFQAGLAGQFGITVLCLVYLPTLAVWGAAYLLGPGFAVGAGTVVSPGDVLLGPVPPLPVLAALPDEALTGAGFALLGAPFAAGLVAGVLLGRRPRPFGAALLAAPVVGLLVQALLLAASGGLGSGRLAQLGPGGGLPALVAVGVVGVGIIVGAVSRRVVSDRPAE